MFSQTFLPNTYSCNQMCSYLSLRSLKKWENVKEGNVIPKTIVKIPVVVRNLGRVMLLALIFFSLSDNAHKNGKKIFIICYQNYNLKFEFACLFVSFFFLGVRGKREQEKESRK